MSRLEMMLACRGDSSWPSTTLTGSDACSRPPEVVKARTQDAWSIANAEYVIEGYLDGSLHAYRERYRALLATGHAAQRHACQRLGDEIEVEEVVE